MKRITLMLIAVATVAGIVAFKAHASGQTSGDAAPIFGVKLPPGYRDWKLISGAHEAGNNNDLRAILGNDMAIRAYREEKLPYPDGTIIAGSPGATSHLKKTTKSSGAINLSSPGHPSMFS
jgi:hypothetical protein